MLYHLGITSTQLLLSLSVRLRHVVAILHDEVLGSVVVLASEVALENRLGSLGVSLLGVDRGTGHVRHHGVATAEGVLGVSQNVVLGRGLREPDVTTVAAKMSGLQGLGNVLLDDDCREPC